jgi:hypothetical protein
MSVYAIMREKIADVADELSKDPGLNKTLCGIIAGFRHSLTKVNEYRGREDTGPRYLLPKFDPFKPTSEDRLHARLARLSGLAYDLTKAEIDLPLGYKPTEKDEGYPYADEMCISVPLFADCTNGSLEVAKINLRADFDEKRSAKSGVGVYSWSTFFVEGHDRTVEVDELSLEKALEFSTAKKQ